jgi:molybdopterin-guanine dinucleotide biosynthesis protein B
VVTLPSSPPLLGFAARSGTGKTTLLAELLPLLEAEGLRVGVIKHSHHDVEIDRPGKDSYRLRKAGARQLILASPYRTVLIEEKRPPREPRLAELVVRLDLGSLDLVLTEGFRHEPFPKIELHRHGLGRPFLHPHDTSIIAIASDRKLDTLLPQLDLNRPRQIVQFILGLISLEQTGARI